MSSDLLTSLLADASAALTPAAGSGHGDALMLFLAGALLCNCVPHLAAGLQGLPFPTPFATPRGVGDSPPLLNVLWGFFNLLVGAALVCRHPVPAGLNLGVTALVAGALVLGIYLALHFGRVQQGKRQR